jgi:NADH:ubiquinone oxidoreductase subunit E
MDAKNDGAIDLSLLEPILAQYQGQRGALIPVLQQAQTVYGYLPRAVLQQIADRMRIPLSKTYGVATFYAQFYLERRGKHVLKLCDGTACHVKGAPGLIDAVRDEFDIQPGQTSEDGELTVEIVYCMGSCALAPVAVMDGQVTGRMQADTLLRKVKKQVEPTEKEALEVTHGSCD